MKLSFINVEKKKKVVMEICENILLLFINYLLIMKIVLFMGLVDSNYINSFICTQVIILN